MAGQQLFDGLHLIARELPVRGPGNLGNWVVADMNHHITFAALQLERLRVSLTSDLTQAETNRLLDTIV